MLPQLMPALLLSTASSAASVKPHGGEPCALVSREWSAQLKESKQSGTEIVPVVDGQLAYDCLNSVPLHADEAVRLVRSIKTFSAFQTTTSYLKNPPASYQFPALDIPAALDEIISNIQGGLYANEYAFHTDLHAFMNKAKDAHFICDTDLISAAIRFRRGDIALASVSLDGVSVPEIYTVSDLRAYNHGTLTNLSRVTLIDGHDAVVFLEDLSALGMLQDRDAQYNTMFYSPVFYAQNEYLGITHGHWQGYFGASGRYGGFYPNASTSVTFANGTTVEIRTVARIEGDFSHITDGESFYKKYCSGTVPVVDVAHPKSHSRTPTRRDVPHAVAGYPTPVVATSDFAAAGYFLPDSDVAVLVLFSFEPDENVPKTEIPLAVQTFLEDVKAAGKTKLIVDLSANEGGEIIYGHDIFRQLFPQIQEDGFTRDRSTEFLHIVSKLFSAAIPPGFNPETSDDDTLITIWESYFNYRFDLNLTNQPFASWEDKFSPETINGDQFTPIHRWNYDDPLLTINDTYGYGFDVTGYRSRASGFTQPFAAEDIILLYDGFCASTCSIMSEFLRLQAGVRSVTFGGRPRLDESGKIPIIQNYGGTKGSGFLGYETIMRIARDTLATLGNASNAMSASVSPLSAAEIAVLELNADSYAFNRTTGTSVNVRDNILRDHLEDGMPAQFVYEPTDCRLFYTPKSVIDPVEQWRQVAEAAWGGKPCAAGSLGPAGTG